MKQKTFSLYRETSLGILRTVFKRVYLSWNVHAILKQLYDFLIGLFD